MAQTMVRNGFARRSRASDSPPVQWELIGFKVPGAGSTKLSFPISIVI